MRFSHCSFTGVCLTVAAFVGCVAVGGGGTAVRAADHRDSPQINNDPAADLLDVYVFVNPNNPNNVVMALTVNPAQLPGLPSVGFASDVLYQLKIDNNGDFKEDLVIQATFDAPGPSQQMTILGPAKPSGKPGATNRLLRNPPTFTGAANGTVVQGSGASPITRASAGLFDDPFFFDLLRILRLIGAAPARENDRAPGIDFYDTTNISSLVIELPRTALIEEGGDNNINVWSTTSRPASTKRSSRGDDKGSTSFIQIERTAIPSENTVFVPRPRKQEFNRTLPADDLRLFREQFITSLVALNNDQAYSANLVDTVLLPDVLRFDVTSSAGFPNGRKFEDDVIDTALKLATNNPAATDNVNANDVPFRSDFPFIAPAHAASETIPGRD